MVAARSKLTKLSNPLLVVVPIMSLHPSMSEDEFLSRIRAHLDSKSSDFQRIFNILIGASLIFFILILLTFSYVQWFEHNETIKLKQIEEKIKYREEARSRLIPAKNGTESAINTILANDSSDSKDPIPYQLINLGTEISVKQIENESALLKRIQTKQPVSLMKMF